jgi:hypothetical protein
MRRETSFEDCIHAIEERFAVLPDKRVGSNQFIQMKDVGLSAFSVFFLQCPSFLEHQRAMRTREGDNNANSLFQIDHVPSDNHIRDLLDKVPPSEVFPLFHTLLTHVADNGQLDEFRYLDGQLLLPLDGLHYFSSKKIHCDCCSEQHHSNGEITYSHSMVSATFVHPNRREVLPLIPMFVEPQDGHDKQDCERAACQRWLSGVGADYASMGVTLLGDDLYCCDPIVRKAAAQGFHFILTCKRDSHKGLYEWVDSLEKSGAIASYTRIIGSTKGKQEWRCRYVNQVPIRNGEEALEVNWCELEVVDGTGKRLYYNTFATDHRISEANVIEVVTAGRTRWKTENEHNNTLKNQGYHLAHNFGHGQEHLSSLLASLILLSFLLHTILRIRDERYRRIRDHYPRESFFNQLRTLLMYLLFVTWAAVMEMMLNGCQPPPRRQKKKKRR